MSESIELRTFNKVKKPKYVKQESDIEEYEEIQNVPNKSKCSMKERNGVTKEYDFFTNNVVSTESTPQNTNKKKSNKTNLIDFISSELALIENPIEENILTNADWFKDSYKFVRERSDSTKHLHWHDPETGTMRPPNISPKYPHVLENIAYDQNYSMQYMPATSFTEFKNKYDEIKEERVKLLNIEISSTTLKCYYEISLEELLEEKIIEIYNDYISIQDVLSNLQKHIKLNRRTKDKFKKELLKMSDLREEMKFDPTLRKYTGELILLKDNYYKNIKLQKNILNNLECLWSDIEMIRRKTKLKRSSIIVKINKSVLSDDEYIEKLNEVFNEEYLDFLEKIEYEYVTKYIKYKKHKHEEKIYSHGKVNKPKLNINEVEIKNEVDNICQFLVNKENITSVSIIKENNVKYKNNRNKKLRDRIFIIKIFVDDMFVCQSETCMINENDTDTFLVQIMPNNTTLVLKIYENNEEQAAYNVDIFNIENKPKRIEIIFNLKIEPTTEIIGCGNFIKVIAHINHLRLKSSNIFKEKINTTCIMNLKVGWNSESENMGQNIDLIKYFEISRMLNQILHNNVDRSKLKNIIEDIYKKDSIKSDELLRKINNVESSYTLQNNDLFSINKNSNNDIRFKLISLRNKGELSDIVNQLIPLNSNQISTEQLTFLQNLKDNLESTNFLNRGFDVDMNHIEIQRYIGVKYTQNINKNILKILNENLMKKTYRDVVRDFQDISLRSVFRKEIKLENSSTFPPGKEHQWLNNKEVEIFITIIRAFNLPDRSSPIITQEADEDTDDDNISGFKMKPLRPFVSINYQESRIQSSTAIGCHPTWNQTLRLKAQAGPPTMLEINIYDEIKMNISNNYADDTSLQSKTVHYRYFNNWLGSVHIPLYAVFNLGKLQGTFKINTPPILLSYETFGKSTSSKMLNINSLIKNGIGVISLQITSNLPYLVGLSHNQPIPAEDYILKHLNNFVTIFENDFPMRRICLTLIDSNGYHKSVTQFLQPIPPPSFECFPKNFKRIESAMSKSSGASKSSSTKSFESKKNDAEKSVTPRSTEKDSLYGYESRSKPDEITRLIFGYLKYVSLIPTYEVNETFNVTLNGLELLKILHGSPLDHTILLASYYLHLSIKCWIVVGVALPKGLSNYILLKYDVKNKRLLSLNDYIYEKTKNRVFGRSDNMVCYLFDATNGEKYELRDISCPLKTVHYAFDDENIWVNIQESQECESVSFDFMKSSNWQPVFDKSVFALKAPAIVDSNLYSLPLDVEDLKLKIESKIKSKVQKWRPHMKTIWNRYCSSLLREALPQWEYWNFCPTEPKPGLGQKLKQLVVTYRMYGFPQNFPFTSLKKIVSSIKSTRLYANDDPDVEFALAVELFSYPNSVISVWIYFVSITKIN